MALSKVSAEELLGFPDHLSPQVVKVGARHRNSPLMDQVDPSHVADAAA
jgi:hypothetical protein